MSRRARARWHGWLISGAVSAAAVAAAPQTAPPSPPTPPPSPGDESFIEFLGSDDVGDAGWWEFLKKTDPHANPPPPPPPPSAGTKQ